MEVRDEESKRNYLMATISSVFVLIAFTTVPYEPLSTKEFIVYFFNTAFHDASNTLV